MKILALLLVLLPTLAHAHPADLQCAPGLDSDDHCQPPLHSLGLDDPNVFESHRQYWHCRRFLVTHETVAIAECVGAIQSLGALVGINYQPSTDEAALLGYWDLIPAHPEFDLLDEGDPKANMTKMDGQTAACIETRAVAQGVLLNCNAKRAWVQSLVKRRMRR